MSFVHKVPRELRKEEDRWFRFFSLKQAIAAVVCIVIVFTTSRVLSASIGFVPMLAVEILIVILFLVGMFVKIPAGNYMVGSGQYLIVVLMHCLIRKTGNLVYVKHLQGADEEGR